MRTIVKGQTNLQEIIFLARCSRRPSGGKIDKEIDITKPEVNMTENVVQDDENQDPVEAYDCDPSNYEAIAMCSQIVHTEPSHEDLSQDCAWKYCDYEENSISGQALHQELLYGGINNEDIHHKHEICCLDFECKECINEAKVRSGLIVHKETSHEDFVINGFLNWSQYQYYDYYNYQDVEDFHMKAEELLEEVEFEDNVKIDALGRSWEKSLESCVNCDIGQMFGVALIAAFIALSEPKKVTLEDSSDIKPGIDVKTRDTLEEIGDPQDDECDECNYEADSRNVLHVYQEPLYEDGYNERRNLELVVCRQRIECEDCDNIFPLKDDLEVHEETSHEEVPRNYWLNCLQEQYYEY